MEDLRREIQWLQHRLDQTEDRQRRSTHSVHEVDEEAEENSFHRKVSSDEDDRPNWFGMAYQRRAPIQPHQSYGVKVELPEFEGLIDSDDFIDWLQTTKRIFEY